MIVSIATGSVIFRPCTSRIQLPLSVTTGFMTPSISRTRHSGWPPSLTSSRATKLRAIGMTSTGNGKAPSTSTSLDSSAIQINILLAAATIFSRVSAAPPPLIIARFAVTSSAPSTYSESVPASLSSMTSTPPARSSLLLASELDTAALIRCLTLRSSVIKKFTVEPVPTPMMVSSSMYCNAAAAAASLSPF